MLRPRSLLLCSLLAVSALAAALQDHPAIKPYEGSTLSRREDVGFSEYTAVKALSPADENAFETTTASGTLTRLFYENPKTRSISEVAANYAEALGKAGFKLLFQCEGKKCGPSFSSSRWGRTTGMKYASSDMAYLSASLSSGGKETLVAIAIIKARHQVDVLEKTAMETGLVTVTAEALKAGLAADGRAVLDGVYFDTDKATLKPESKAALDVIAAFLQANAALSAFVVGHTDGVGTFEHNLALSSSRAKAVVDELSKRGVAKARLTPHGVGPLAPATTNQTDGGRGRNRRVELVERQ